MKVVQYLVKEVNQFPSDVECMRYIATIADKVGGVFFSFWCSGAQCQDLFVYFICHSRAITLFCFFLGAVEEVPPVHGDHRQSQRPAGS